MPFTQIEIYKRVIESMNMAQREITRRLATNFVSIQTIRDTDTLGGSLTVLLSKQ
jgi:hypothetical protein